MIPRNDGHISVLQTTKDYLAVRPTNDFDLFSIVFVCSCFLFVCSCLFFFPSDEEIQE